MTPTETYDYATWRAAAEKRLAKMEAGRRERRLDLFRLNGEIHELLHVMANGASGGTAWKITNVPVSDGANHK